MNIPDSLLELAVDVAELVPYRTNPRRGDVGRIAESLEANGQYRPIVVRRSTNEVLAGNHTLLAARQLGWPKVAATFVDVDDDQAARIVLVDNRTNDLAGYDDDLLLELLQSIPDLGGTGFTSSELDELLNAAGQEPEKRTDPDDVPLPPRKRVSRDGDVWQLGPHRLVVGDSTDPAVVALACDGVKADLVVTDPPYNIDYQGGTAEAMTIANDSMDDDAFLAFLRAAYAAALSSTKRGGPIYVFHAISESGNFKQGMLDAGWRYAQTLVWVKDRFVLSRQDYNWQHEACLYGWKPGAAHRWFGGFSTSTVLGDGPKAAKDMSKAELVAIVEQVLAASDVLEADKPTANDVHPTMKPVELVARLVENSSRAGDLVLDPFGGSGSTLIACHGTRRRAALVEVDPRYADVICRRYQEHTGVVPLRDGKPHDFAR